MKNDILVKCLLAGVMGSACVLADMTVVKSADGLTVTSTISGTIVAKVIGPNDEVVVDRKYEGNSFTWTPSGVDGAYRYDVRVISAMQKADNTEEFLAIKSSLNAKSDYAGGSIEVNNGQIITTHNKPKQGENNEK